MTGGKREEMLGWGCSGGVGWDMLMMMMMGNWRLMAEDLSCDGRLIDHRLDVEGHISAAPTPDRSPNLLPRHSLPVRVT